MLDRKAILFTKLEENEILTILSKVTHPYKDGYLFEGDLQKKPIQIKPIFKVRGNQYILKLQLKKHKKGSKVVISFSYSSIYKNLLYISGCALLVLTLLYCINFKNLQKEIPLWIIPVILPTGFLVGIFSFYNYKVDSINKLKELLKA